MRIESGEQLLRQLDQAGIDGVKFEDGHLKTRNFFAGILRKIGDAFLSLSESGRAAIQERNDHLHAAMANWLRRGDDKTPGTDIAAGEHTSATRALLARFAEDEKVFKVLVRRNPAALQYAPEHLRSEDLCLEALRRSGRDGMPARHYLPDDMYDRIWQSLLDGMGRTASVMLDAPACFRWNEEFCKAAVQQHAMALGGVPEELRTKDLCKEAVRLDSWALKHVPKELRKDEDICKEAVKQDARVMQIIPFEHRTKPVCLEAVKRSVGALQYVPPKLQKDPDIRLEIVKQNGMALQDVPGESQNEKICLAAVQQNGMALKYVHELYQTRNVCLAAVRQDGMALQDVPDGIMKIRLWGVEICLEAVKQNGMALQFVPDNLKEEIREALGQGS